MRSGSLMMSRTVIRGFSDAYGSWNTICISRRHGLGELRMAADQLLREMARRLVTRPDVDGPQLRHLLAAPEAPLRQEAARMKRAAGRPVDERRRLPGNRSQPLLVLRQL